MTRNRILAALCVAAGILLWSLDIISSDMLMQLLEGLEI